MSISTECLAAACRRLNIPYSFVADDENLLRVEIGQKHFYFPGNVMPFNNDATVKICRDKEFTFKVLKGLLTIPKTLGFVDPEGPEIYRDYARLTSHTEIVDRICAEFTFPVIVKRNSGTQGQNVFLCQNQSEVATAVQKIFDQEPSGYDYVILAQEYLSAQAEYRVIAFRHDVLLVYRKDNSAATFTGNLSPLHWDNAKAVLLEDPTLTMEFQNFIAPIYERIDLEYAGLDIIRDQRGELHLIEINTRPGFSYFVRDNGPEPLVTMYARILTALRGTTA